MAVKGTWKNGGSGKGDKVCKGTDMLKISKQMDTIKSTEPKKKSCGSCRHFSGVNVIGNSLCKKEVKYNLNTAKEECKEWEWLNE